jgi:inner membrane protein
MRWISHELVTGVLVYAFTGGNAICAAAACAGSLVPDAIEGRVPRDPRGKMRWERSHRAISHWFVPYCLGAGSGFAAWLVTEHSAITPAGMVLALICGRNRGTLFLIAGFVFLGALFHIGEDALCGCVPSFNPGKRMGVRLFSVGSVREQLITAFVVASFVIVCLKGVLW